jgi:hypothetical protein
MLSIKQLSNSDLLKMRVELLSEDACDFEHQEDIAEDVIRIEYELRVNRNVSI